jgi:hypothetical protein
VWRIATLSMSWSAVCVVPVEAASMTRLAVSSMPAMNSLSTIVTAAAFGSFSCRVRSAPPAVRSSTTRARLNSSFDSVSGSWLTVCTIAPFQWIDTWLPLGSPPELSESKPIPSAPAHSARPSRAGRCRPCRTACSA